MFNTLGLLLCFNTTCNAQLHANTLFEYNQHYEAPYLINPSTTDTSYTARVNFTGLNELRLNNVARYFFDGDLALKEIDRNENHNLGIQLTSSQLGEYIRKSRFYIRYGYFSQLSKAAAISAGIQLGAVNYSFETTHGGAGGADLGPDGSIGIHYLREDFSIGASIQQILSSEIMPLDQVYKLNRTFNSDVRKSFKLSPQFTIKSFIIVQLAPKEISKLNSRFGATLMAYDQLILGINTYSLKKSSITIGAKNIDWQNLKLDLIASYSQYHVEVPLPDTSIEIALILKYY